MSLGGTFNGVAAKVRDVVRSMRYLELTAEPRTVFQYCNMMYLAASHLLETVQAKWLGDIFRERIWAPLGMVSTFLSYETGASSQNFFAQGYVYANESYNSVPLMDLDVVSGAGAIISNVLDYIKWLRAMMRGEGPISPAGHRALRAAHFITDDITPPFTGPRSYTFGWMRSVYQNQECFFHSGGLEAYVTLAAFCPKLEFGFSSFTNIAGTGAGITQNALMFELLDNNWIQLVLIKEQWSRARRSKKTRSRKRGADILPTYRLSSSASLPPFRELHRNIHQPRLPRDDRRAARWRPLNVSLAPIPTSNLPNTLSTTGKIDNELGPMLTGPTSERTNTAFRVALDFTHVSGNYCIVTTRSLAAVGFANFAVAGPGEFVVGADGVVGRFGFANEMNAQGTDAVVMICESFLLLFIWREQECGES